MTNLNGNGQHSSHRTSKFTYSSPKKPCPVCGRTKDGDCRLTEDNRVFCHTHQGDKVGDTRRGADGQEWACVDNTTDGAGWGIFKVHQPLEKRERWQKPPRNFPRREWEYQHPDGSKHIFYREQGQKGRWSKGAKPKELLPLYHAKIAPAVDAGEFVVLGEGEPVAQALQEIGICGTTLAGGAGATLNRDAIQILQPAYDAGRLVFAPDRDQQGLKLQATVLSVFPQVKFLYAEPDNWEWSDLPKNGGYDLEDWIADLKKQGLDNAAVKARLLAAIGDQRESVMSSPADVSAVSKQPGEESLSFLEQAIDDLYADGRYITLNQQDLYRWGGTHYELVPDCQELARITAYCRGRKFSPSVVKNILELQKLATGITTEEVNPPGYFNCKNGVLHWWWEGDTLRTELLPHNPDLIFIDPPAVAYNPDADSRALNRLLECLEPQPREILIRTLACALDLPAIRKRKARTPRAVLLYGTGANGKDTIRTAVFRLFGGRGCTAVSLSDFQAYDAGRKFGLADLEHSRVNWPSETVPAGKLDRIESLKLVTTGDPISIERKGIQERRLPPQTVLLFNCNQPPNMTAATEAIKSRYAIIPFTKTYKANPDPAKGELLADPRFKDDPQFIDREILPALLNLLLAKLQVVAVDGIDYSPVADQIDELRRRSSHLIQFCEDTGLIEDPDGIVSVTELWAKLEAWYIANNYLSIEQGARGGQKRNWEHPGNGDRCVTASHQVLQRFTELFPKVRRKTWRNRAEGQDRVTTYLHGINFVPEILKVGSPGSPRTNDNAANPTIEPIKNGDPTQHHRVTGESPGVTAGSPPPPNGDPYPGSGDSPLNRVTAQGHHSETPINTGSEGVNAVHGDPGDPDLQIPTQQKTGAPPPVNCGQKFKPGQMVRYTGRDPELQKQLPAPALVTSVQTWDKTLWVQRPSGGDVTVPMADVEVVQ